MFRSTLAAEGDLRTAITRGKVTGTRMRSLRTKLDLTIADLAHLLGASERSVIRKEQRRASLSVVDADRVYRLARVADLAVDFLGDASRAKRWLKTAHRYFGDETPMAVLDTEIGNDLVIESLYAIGFGGVG